MIPSITFHIIQPSFSLNQRIPDSDRKNKFLNNKSGTYPFHFSHYLLSLQILMKKNKGISNNPFTILLSAILVVALLCVNVFSSAVHQEVKKTDKQTQTVIKKQEVHAVIFPSFGAQTDRIFVLTVSHNFPVLISYITTFTENGFSQIILSKLFPRIISPNAP